jgi:hypothetical protein
MKDQVMDARRMRRRPDRQRGWRTIWQHYKFELIWLAIVAVGLFLIIEEMNIRETLFRWLRSAAAALFQGSTQLSRQVGQTLQRLTTSDLLGYLLVIAAAVALVWRVRWRFRHSEAFTALRCPRCGGNIHRKHRNIGDRLISIAVPVRRYRCVNSECRWRGLRVTAFDVAPRPGPRGRTDAR